MNGIADVCHCGHDISTHHPEIQSRSVTIVVEKDGKRTETSKDELMVVRFDCLGMHCSCRLYTHRDKPETITEYKWRNRPNDPSLDRASFYTTSNGKKRT